MSRGRIATFLFAVVALTVVSLVTLQVVAQQPWRPGEGSARGEGGSSSGDSGSEGGGEDSSKGDGTRQDGSSGDASGDPPVDARGDAQGDASGSPSGSASSGERDGVELRGADEESAGAAGVADVLDGDGAVVSVGTEVVGEAAPLRYELERVEVRGNVRTHERVVLRYLKLRPGDVVEVDDPEWKLVQYRLLGTGFFQRVNLSLRRGTRHGRVVLVIDVVERNTIVIGELWMGLSADADTDGRSRPLTAYSGVDVAETNLGGTGITVGAGIGFAQEQLGLRGRFFNPSAFGTEWMTSASVLYNNAAEFYGNRGVKYDDSYATSKVVDYAVVRYKRVGGTVGVGLDLSVAWQGWMDCRFDRIDATLPLAASHQRGLDVEPIEFGLSRGVSWLTGVGYTLIYDTRDSPILSSRGARVAMSAQAAVTPFGSDYSFQRYTLDVSKWVELPWTHVVRMGLFVGAIVGDAPIFERFYVGDFTDLLPSRMFGLNVDRRPPPDFLGTSIVEVRYGTYAFKLTGEYRVPLYRGSRSVYGIDLFGSGGIYGVASERDLRDPPRGYSGFSRIPLDLTANAGLQIDTNAGGFTIAVSNLLGFIPERSEARR